MKILRDPWWQSAGAILAALGIVIALVPPGRGTPSTADPAPTAPSVAPAGKAPLSPASSPPAPSPSPLPAGGGGNTVNCSNGAGDNNTNNCAIVPVKPIGGVDYELQQTQFAWFNGSIDQLPRPTKGDIKSSECDQWGDWLTATPDLYLVDPILDLTLTGNWVDRVAITHLDSAVYSRTKLKPSDGVLINCRWGGGELSFCYAEINTLTGKTRFQNNENGLPVDEGWVSMPPGQITLKDNGYTSAEMTIDSMDDRMYQGSIRATAFVNGEKGKFAVGTSDRPLRWATPTFAERLDEEGASFGWNAKTKRWVKGFSPPMD